MRKAGLAGGQMARWTGVVGRAEEGRGRGVAAPVPAPPGPCAHLLLGFLQDIACLDDLLIFLPPQAQEKRDPLCGGGREKKGLTFGA